MWLNGLSPLTTRCLILQAVTHDGHDYVWPVIDRVFKKLQTIVIMLKQIATSTKSLWPVINPFRLGEPLPLNTRLDFSSRRKKRIGILFYIAALVFAYLFFLNYDYALSTRRLLTTDVWLITRTILVPILSLTVFIYCFTIAMTLARNIVPVFLIALIYVAMHPLTLLNIGSGALVLVAFLIYYFEYFIVFEEFKRPTMAKSINSSLGIFLIVLSLGLSLNSYDAFAVHAIQTVNRLGNAAAQRYSFIYDSFTFQERSLLQAETLQSYVKKRLAFEGKPITNAAVLEQEKAIVTGLGLSKAQPSDSMKSLGDLAVKKQVSVLVNNYRKLILITLPFAFFFVTQTLTSISFFITFCAMYLSEKLIRSRPSALPLDDTPRYL